MIVPTHEKKDENSESKAANKAENQSPSGTAWEIHYTEEGHPYYWNTQTLTPSWTLPEELANNNSPNNSFSSSTSTLPPFPHHLSLEEDLLLLTHIQKEGYLDKGYPGVSTGKIFFKKHVTFQRVFPIH